MGEVYRARDPRLGREVALRTDFPVFNTRLRERGVLNIIVTEP